MRTEALEYTCFETDHELLEAAEAVCDMHENENINIGLLDGMSAAAIGISGDQQIIYSYNKMVEILVNRDGMTTEEAIEFIDYNTIRVIDYMPAKPIILYDFQI